MSVATETTDSGSSLIQPDCELCSMVVGKANQSVRFQEIGPNLWCLFTIHGAGNSRFGPKLPNRMLVFHLRDAAGKGVLAVLNVVMPDLARDEPFNALRALSDDLNAPVGFLLNPGPEHHLSLAEYARAFPDARVCVAAGRVERENPDLCALPNVETMANGDVLPELSRQGLHVHVWGGFMESSFTNRSQFRFLARRGTAEPTLFWHEASGSLVNGGHGWVYWAAGASFPYLFRKLLKPTHGTVVWSPVHYVIHDRNRVREGAQRILDWRFDSLLDLHAPMNMHLRGTARGVVEELLAPVTSEEWETLPFGSDVLSIPEGTVTGGNWKSYRKLSA